jgi:cytidine deaminase
MEYNDLILKAKETLKNAYTPYSHYQVGASVLTKSGKVFTGCNIENASYGLTICAERTAIFKAVSEGEKEIIALAVINSSDDYSRPCGSCRQVMAEFMKDDAKIILANKNGDYVVKTLEQILPDAFRL